MSDVYHVELRQFPHTARVFNLELPEVDTRFVQPWVKGEMIDHDERRWAPERTRLKILSGPVIRLDELGLGRGWGQATKDSEDVTGTVVAAAQRGAQARPEVEALKEKVMQRAGEPIGMREVVALAGGAHPGWRASEQLSVAEQAIWELLHQEHVAMVCGGAEVPRERWQETVLRFSSWASASDQEAISVRAIAGGNGRG